MNQLSQITQQNASAAEELAATAEELSGQTEQMLQMMSFFKLQGVAGERSAAIRRPKAKTTIARVASQRLMSEAPTHNPNEFVKF